MDKEKKKMVDKLQSILQQLRMRGEINLFMIIKMGTLTDKWTVIFSAPWVTPHNRDEAFNYVRNLLLQTLDDNEKSSIGGIAIIENTNHLVQVFTTQVRVVEGFTHLQNTSVNEYSINDAYIFESNISNPPSNPTSI